MIQNVALSIPGIASRRTINDCHSSIQRPHRRVICRASAQHTLRHNRKGKPTAQRRTAMKATTGRSCDRRTHRRVGGADSGNRKPLLRSHGDGTLCRRAATHLDHLAVIRGATLVPSLYNRATRRRPSSTGVDTQPAMCSRTTRLPALISPAHPHHTLPSTQASPSAASTATTTRHPARMHSTLHPVCCGWGLQLHERSTRRSCLPPTAVDTQAVATCRLPPRGYCSHTALSRVHNTKTGRSQVGSVTSTARRAAHQAAVQATCSQHAGMHRATAGTCGRATAPRPASSRCPGSTPDLRMHNALCIPRTRAA
jgi:hypothetical protein